MYIYHITTNPGTSMTIRRIRTFFLALAQPKGVCVFISADAIWLLQLFSPMHVTLGKIGAKLDSFDWGNYCLSCQWVWSDLICSGQVCCDVPEH